LPSGLEDAGLVDDGEVPTRSKVGKRKGARSSTQARLEAEVGDQDKVVTPLLSSTRLVEEDPYEGSGPDSHNLGPKAFGATSAESDRLRMCIAFLNLQSFKLQRSRCHASPLRLYAPFPMKLKRSWANTQQAFADEGKLGWGWVLIHGSRFPSLTWPEIALLASEVSCTVGCFY